MVEDNRKLDVQNVLETNQGTFVVTGVSYTENPETGERKYTYHIVDPADLIVEEEPTEEE
jgi:hypothetical protein